MAQEMGLTDVLNHIDDEADNDVIKVKDMVEGIGARGYGPILLGLALIEILPTGAIPGVPTLVAVLVLLIAGQMVVGRKHPWIPNKLGDKGFEQGKIDKVRQKLQPTTNRIDRFLKPRMQYLTGRTAARIVGVICMILAVTMPPLEVVPFASSAPALAIAMLGLGLSSNDGLLIMIGFILSAAAMTGAVYWLL